jgi:uncharacterized protein (DUF2235 family)
MPNRKGGFRHLIYLIDGTWLWAGSDKTLDVYSNVYRLNTLLTPDDKDGRAQIVHYVRGLGAVRGKKMQYKQGGFAAGIDDYCRSLRQRLLQLSNRRQNLYFRLLARSGNCPRSHRSAFSRHP